MTRIQMQKCLEMEKLGFKTVSPLNRTPTYVLNNEGVVIGGPIRMVRQDWVNQEIQETYICIESDGSITYNQGPQFLVE